MDTLMAYCKAEGDFKWGVAIHPYPENLLDPKAWLDKKNTYATDTPYITFKNLEGFFHVKTLLFLHYLNK